MRAAASHSVVCSLADTRWRAQADREVEKIVDKRTVMPGVKVGYVQKVTEGADALFDDEEERACQLLALRGCSPAVCKAICAGELASGCPAKGLFDHIKCMNEQLLGMTIEKATAQVAAEEQAATRLEKASSLMLAGDYAGALRIYDDVLAAHPENEEATRGSVEARKGMQFLAMMESGSDGDMLAMMMSNLGDDDDDVEIPSMPLPTGSAPAPVAAPLAPQADRLPRSPFSRDSGGSQTAQGMASATSPAAPAAPATQAPVFGNPATYGQQTTVVVAPAAGSAADILSQQRQILMQRSNTGNGAGSTAPAGAM